jgi:exonuclease III
VYKVYILYDVDDWSKIGTQDVRCMSDQALLREALMVGVCETWLNQGIMDTEVLHNFTGYSLFRGDRQVRQGGGVALYLQDNLSGDLLASFDNSVCQGIAVMVHQTNTCVVVCYRPPDTRAAEFSDMLDSLDSVLATLPTPTPNIVLMGDFNLPRSVVQWQRSDEGNLFPHREEETPRGKQDRLQAHRLMEFAAKHFLQQLTW